VIAIPQTDVTPPTVSASPNAGSFVLPQSVTLTANEAGSDIYYTTNGNDPVLGDILDPFATLYTMPISISVNTLLKFVAFDPASNVSQIVEQNYLITNNPVPATPAFTTSSVGLGSITLNWTSGDSSVTSYTLQPSTSVGDLAPVTVLAPATTATFSGLSASQSYFFTITATNSNGTSPASAKFGPLTPQGAVVANAGPDQTIARKTTPTSVALTGAGSTTASASYQWTQLKTGTTLPIGATDPDKVTINTPTSVNASFSLPLYKFPMTNNALTFRLTVTTPAGSKTDDMLVTPVPDQVAIGTAKWKAGDFRVVGTGSTVGGTILVHKGSLSGPVIATAGLTAAAPPAVGAVFDARNKTTTDVNLATNPTTVWIESSLGGTAGPFAVAG
jgi:hypothetical protein